MTAPAMAPELRAAFERERVESNGRRLRVLLPLMVAGHAVHVAVFWPSAAQRASLEPRLLAWREGVAVTHAATLAIAALLALGVWRAGRTRAAPLFAPATGALYVLHGAIIGGVDQLSVPSVTPFIGYSLGAAVVLALSPVALAAVEALGLVAFVAAIVTMQPSASARLAELPNGFSIVVLSTALGLVLHAARRKDFVQRTTIERQRAELAELNAVLERRVAEQVSEIVARAQDVERLNAQLRAQIATRSSELSAALAKLARRNAGPRAVRPGDVLGEQYEIHRMIGEGGMGAVYAGIDRATGTRVAIKVIQPGNARRLDAWHRFLREAGSAARVDHPAVVRMLHVGVTGDGMLFQVQELVEGEELQARLRVGSPWRPAVAARLGAVLAEALAAAHALGVVHRDVKPANVMLTRAAPGLKLLDFGIAKLYDDAASDGATHTGMLIGTPMYMAPEQLESPGQVSGASDVYAVGVILFALFTGELPYAAPTPRAAIANLLVDQPPDPRGLEPGVPEPLAAIARACLARRPEERPAASALASRLGAFADEQGLPALDALEREGALCDARTRAIQVEKTHVIKSAPPG